MVQKIKTKMDHRMGTEQDALRAFTQASCRSIKSYFTSKSVLNIIKTNIRIRIFHKSYVQVFTIQVPLLSVLSSPFEVLLTTILVFFLQQQRYTSQHYSVFVFKSAVILFASVFVLRHLLSCENELSTSFVYLAGFKAT